MPLQSDPGVFTAIDAFASLRAGATGLKLFPASLFGVSSIKALKAVLPPSAPLHAVGVIGADDLEARAHQAIKAMKDAFYS